MTNKTETNSNETVRLCQGYLATPDYLPRAWSEMTPSEQAMTIWFMRDRSFCKDLVARHVIACAIKKNGGTITEKEADDLWALFFGPKPE